MNKHVRWLWEQLEVWAARGVISREQAGQIRTLYPEPKAAPPWGTIIFSGLGAVIVGLGIVLLFAYNWNVLPKAAKLAVVFLVLVGAHGGGIWLFRRSDWQRPLGEALCVLGTMFFGAGIWLVAQIYHIDEHFPNGFLIWGLGALAMAWALPSPAHGLLAVVVLCIWNCTEAWDFQMPVHWGPILLLLGPGALAWWQRSRLLLFFSLAGFGLAVIANASEARTGFLIPVVMSLAAAFIAVRVLVPRHTGFPEAAPVWGFFGWLGFLVCAYLMTFHGIVDDLLRWHWRADTANRFVPLAYVGVPFVLALLAWSAVAWSWLKDAARARCDCPYENWGVQFRLVYRPPDREATRNLPHAALLWHGRLRSRAFTPDGVPRD